MTRSSSKVCSIFFVAAILSLCGLANAIQEPDRAKAARTIADSETFKDCHTGINNWDACNWTIYLGRWNSIAGYWGSSAAHPQPDSLKGNAVGYWLLKQNYLQLSLSPETIAFSDKGKTASKDWKRVALPGRKANEPQGQRERWEVPLATKKVVGITRVLRGERMGAQFAEVHYTWVYALTPLGTELFSNKQIPSTGRNVGGSIAPAELTGIDLKKTYEATAIFVLHNDGWRLQEDCQGDIC
jgi:hypothetical protein